MALDRRMNMVLTDLKLEITKIKIETKPKVMKNMTRLTSLNFFQEDKSSVLKMFIAYVLLGVN